MKYTLHHNLESRTGLISNLHGFMNRNLDTGFKSKWSGYWSPPYKFLDYYGVRINGVWLGSETVEAVEYGEAMVFHHETGSLRIEEHVETPESLPGFRIQLKVHNLTDDRKALQAALEPGIDIRSVDEDLGPESYETETGGNRFTARKEDRKLMITGDSFELKDEERIKTHYPGERQRCMVPGKLVFRRELEPGKSETINIEFSTSDASFSSIENVEQDLEHSLGRSFSCSIDSLRNLVYDRKGKGIIAGHPWFQSYWARDTFWSLLGLIDAGYFDLSRQILLNYAERDLPGRIGLDDSEEVVEREDTYPLFIIAADKLRRHSHIDEKIESAMKQAMQKLELEGNIVQHSPEGTWMDTLERKQAIEIQSLWPKAAEIVGDPAEKKLREGLQNFVDDGTLKDCLSGSSSDTINPAVPLMFGQVKPEVAEKQLEKINGEFSSPYGARTRSAIDPGYDSSGYHTGSSWGLTTGWASCANLEYGRTTQGLNFLRKMEELLDRNQPGALPEVVDSESGELLGCPEQAWSPGLLVHAVDSYLLGIRPGKEKVLIDPVIETEAERTGKRIKGEKVDLRFREGDVEILNDPDLEFEIDS